MKRHSLTAAAAAWMIGFAALLAPIACLGAVPAISPGGVVSAGAFGGFTSIAPGSWIEIYGSNLAVNTRSWVASDFSGVNAPTSLDGTSVTIAGQQAFVDYISLGQVNAQVPSNVAVGSQQIVVTAPGGSSVPYTVTVNAAQPGLLAPSSFNVGGKQYAVALFPDGVTYVLPPGAVAGLSSRRAQPGDTITLYGVGFGPVVPNIPAGQIVQQNNTLAASLQVGFGTIPATLQYDGLAPDAVGLYQFNVVVPNVPSSDTSPLTFTLGGVAGAQALYLAIQNGNAAAPQIQSLTISPSTVASGGTAQGMITLSAAAPAGGAVVALSSSASIVSVPATVTVPAGIVSALFSVSTSASSAEGSIIVTASYAGSSAQATIVLSGASSLPPLSYVIIGTGTVTVDGFNGVPSVMAQQLGTSAPGAAVTFNFVPTPSALPRVLSISAGFLNVVQSGQILTFSDLAASSYMLSGSGSLYGITSGSMTVTLTPEGSPIIGSATGTFSFTSPLENVTSTFSGSYTAALVP